MAVEYNKIHALANARRVVMGKFGSNMLYFWPMADSTPFIRDLMRQKSLVGSGIAVQQPGMLDYAVNLQSGYISDVVKEVGGPHCPHDYQASGSDYYFAVPVPPGRWTGLKLRNTGGSGLTDGVVIAPPNTAPSSVLASKLFSADTTPSSDLLLANDSNLTQFRGLYNGGYIRFGQRATLNGQIGMVSFYLRKSGSPTGTISCKVYRVSDNALLGTADTTLDASTLTTSYQWVMFQFNTPLNVNTDVRVVIEWIGGDTSNYIQVATSGDQVSGYMCDYYNGAWYENPGIDAGIMIGLPPAIHAVTFPFILDADTGVWWAYLKSGSCRDTSGGDYGYDGKSWNGASYVDLDDMLVEFQGPSAETWASYDKFTICLLVNLDNCPANGVLLALSDASESKVRIYVNSDKKVEGKFKNTNGDVYTLTSLRPLHPGFNLLTLSYERNVAIKLGVNGLVAATGTPSNFPLFNTTLALGIGAQMLTGKTTSSQLKNALVDDVFIAKGVVPDADLWDIYMSYLTAAPLMQVEGSEQVVLS